MLLHSISKLGLCTSFCTEIFRMLQSGLSDEKVELPLLLAWMAFYTVFTARKFSQPIKVDDPSLRANKIALIELKDYILLAFG